MMLVTTLGIASLAPGQRRGWGSGPNAASQPAERGATTAPVGDAYAAVVERNIFVRDRRPPVVVSTRPASSRPYVPPPTLEASLVLRGVVLEDGYFRAYFENAQSNEIVRVAAGDALAKGHVAEISIDAVAFETSAGLAWIKIGDNLAGARVAEPAASASSSSLTTGQPGSAATTGPAGASSIEERMRLRRQQRAGGR